MSSSSAAPPDDDLQFFVDRSFGSKQVFEGLVSAGFAAKRHDDLFPQDAPDTAWLEYAGDNGLVVVTRDQRIRSRGTEVAMIVAAKVKAFIFSSPGLSGRQATELVVAAAPKMLEIARLEEPPFAYSVTRGPALKALALPSRKTLGLD